MTQLDTVNDKLTYMPSGRHQLYAYFNDNPKWPAGKRRLTYNIISSPSTVSIDPSVLSSIFSNAFSLWSAVMSFTFTEVSPISKSDHHLVLLQHPWGPSVRQAATPAGARVRAMNMMFHLDAAEECVVQGDVAQASLARVMDLESGAMHK